MTKRILACPDEPLPLFLAASQFNRDEDRFAIIRSDTLLRQMKAWADDRSIKEVLILTESLAKIRKPELVEKLVLLAEQGKRVTWCCNERMGAVIDAASEVIGINVLAGPTLADAVAKLGLPTGPYFRHYWETMNSADFRIDAYVRARLAMAEMETLATGDSGPSKDAQVAPIVESLSRIIRRNSIFPNEEEKELLRLFDGNDHFLEGRTAAILALKQRIAQVARTRLNSLIIGETGTGKEATAFFLHALGERRKKAFRALNCAGIDEELMRSTLFGHKKGAFSSAYNDFKGEIAAAEGGTLFLDEVGELKPTVQAALLRFIQTKEYTPVGSTEPRKADVRFIFAGQPSIFEKLQKKEFREDFFYRIAEVQLWTPSLREMKDDLPEMVRHLVKRFCKGSGKHHHYFLNAIDEQEGAWDKLRAFPWPGNVRQLAGFLKRWILLETPFSRELAEMESLASKAEKPGSDIFFGNEILPLREVLSRYVKHVERTHPELMDKEICRKLDIAFNTYKKYLSGSGS